MHRRVGRVDVSHVRHRVRSIDRQRGSVVHTCAPNASKLHATVSTFDQNRCSASSSTIASICQVDGPPALPDGRRYFQGAGRPSLAGGHGCLHLALGH